MPFALETFRHEGNRHFGTTLFKALGHPKAAEQAQALVARLQDTGPIVIIDPDGTADAFDMLYGLSECNIAGVYVQDLKDLSRTVMGRPVYPLSALETAGPVTRFAARFDSGRLRDQINAIAPDAPWTSFDDIRIPDGWLSNPRRYLDRLNFATNFALMREAGGHHTVLQSANYWGAYGAENAEIWLCLFDANGNILAEWRQPLPVANGTYAIDSREVRKRFGLGEFTGSLFIHALRIKGHDVVKYTLDTFGEDETVMSATHDANAWPADFYAGLPAPEDGEKVVLWVQNSHPIPIPAGGIGINVMGSKEVVSIDEEIPGFATRPVDAGALLPEACWPAQLEIQAGRYFVRPRYEVFGPTRSRIAHVNVERTDLSPDQDLLQLGNHLGKGFILPIPILPLDRYATSILPTPMARKQDNLPLAAIVAAPDGRELKRHFLGCLPRGHTELLEIDVLANGDKNSFGHVELVYDFQDGGSGDGWLHAIARFKDRDTGHVAETSFGAHIFNILEVYKDEPQSYAGPPPGLSTRLFLRIGPTNTETFCYLIYAASKPWRPLSNTQLALHDADGSEIATEKVQIACGGSLLWSAEDVFGAATLEKAGSGCYVLVRDTTCRLFGYHGLRSRVAFSFDHMFGF